MLTVEVRANGLLLTHTSIVNQQFSHDNGTLYKVSHYNANDHETLETKVMHCRKDGPERLVELAMAKVRQERSRHEAKDTQ